MPESDAGDRGAPSTSSFSPGAHGRPPRPAMSDTTPAPVPPPIVLNATMKTARVLWLLSFLAGITALATAFLYREIQLENLRNVIVDFAPDRAASTVDTVAHILFWGSLGTLTGVILFQSILVRSMLNRHGRARIGLLLLVVVDLGVAFTADAFLAEPGAEGILFTGLLLLQLGLAVMALIAGFLPGAHRFFRSGRQPRQGAPA